MGSKQINLTPARFEGTPCKRCGNKIRHISNRKCVACATAANQANKRRRKYTSKRQREVVSEVIAALGGACYCCGETHPKFLTVDHVEPLGDNANRPHMYVVYRQIRAEGYPRDKYRVACWNCNCGRARNGGTCPHLEASK